MTTRKLSDQETAAINKEYQALAVRVEAQCLEQIVFLKTEIQEDMLIGSARSVRLCQILDNGGYEVKLFQVNDANTSKTLQVQVVYEIDDELDAYLSQPALMLPKRLVGFLAGGTDLPTSKPTAVDPTPATGKTKTGVHEYDAILAQRKKP